MIHAQGGEGALELGMSVETVGGGGMAKEGQSVGVVGGGTTMDFEGRAHKTEVAPSGIRIEAASDDSAAVIIGGEDEGLEGGTWPPLMRGGIVLPELADGDGFPAAAGFGAWRQWGCQLWEMETDVIGDSGSGSGELVATSDLVGQKSKIDGLRERKDIGQELVDGLGPVGLVVAPGGVEVESFVLGQPVGAQIVEVGAADLEALGGGLPVHEAVVEELNDFGDSVGTDAVS